MKSRVPARRFERDGKTIYSKLDKDGNDLTIDNCEFIIVSCPNIETRLEYVNRT